MPAERSLSGKVIAITGGARGIGLATAKMLAAEGAKVAIGDLDADLAAQAGTEAGNGAIGLALDVTDIDGFTAFLDQVEEQLGPLYGLVNNAGIMPTNPIDEEPDDSTRRQIEINLHAVIHGTRESIKRMKPRGTGHIVNISSAAGRIPGARVSVYTATKFAVAGFSESISLELHGTGVEISCVFPTLVKTELTAGLKDLRGMPRVEPEKIAEAIVAAFKKPRFEVPVPRSLGFLLTFNQFMPYGLRSRLSRLIRADSVIADADADARSAYEERVNRTVAADSAEAESEPAQERTPV